MLKEIHDQPTSLSNVLSGRISADGLTAELGGCHYLPRNNETRQNNFVACGTAYYASEIICSYIQRLSSVRCRMFIAMNSCKVRMLESTLTIGVSQSGETKDTLDALFDAKKFGSHISSICNVIGSTMARFTGNGVYLHAGPEYAVASTKVFSNMVAAGLIFALTISNINDSEKKEILKELRRIPNTISSQFLDLDDSIKRATRLILDSSPPIFIGRGGLSSYIAKEGALKMMEISYIPCLSLPGGELKHGPIALLSNDSPVVAVVPTDSKLNLMESSIRECKARGAKIILITDNEGPLADLADILIQTPTVHPDLSPFTSIIPIQLLAYQVGVEKGINVDGQETR